MKLKVLYILSIGIVLQTNLIATEIQKLDSFRVVGSSENVSQITGSAHFLSEKDINTFGYQNVGEVLAKVPGVYVRGEDGYGLFPNISLRGVDSGRSAKVTLMEDGILMAPAPYSAPSAYYSPTIGRMSSIEILKGSSQIKYGPHTTGGVVNYISTQIPNQQRSSIKTSIGTDEDYNFHFTTGNTLGGDNGNWGYILEYVIRDAGGFKAIDETPDFSDGEDTGFRKQDSMIKLFWEPNSDRYHRWEIKLGYTDWDANETYLGLTDQDFDNDPYRRYSASRFDNNKSHQFRSYLRHVTDLTTEIRLNSVIYYNKFHRNWFKLRGGGDDLLDPMTYAVWTGRAAGELKYRHNNRDYYSTGIQSSLDWMVDGENAQHQIEVGVRYHVDEVDRFQKNTSFFQNDLGVITSTVDGVKGGGGNREQKTSALAFFVKDTIKTGNWTFTPGIRVERLDLEYTDFNTKGFPDQVTGEDDGFLTLVAPGVGFLYQVNNNLNWFGGVFKGFSPPGPRSAIKSDVEEETSLGYELGLRYFGENDLETSVTFFLTDFSDLVVADSIALGVGTGKSFNVGDVSSSGIEASFSYDLGKANSWNIRVPVFASVTYTKSELDGDASSGDNESIFSNGEDGNQVPYIPELKASAGISWIWNKFSINLVGNYYDETFSTASNVESSVTPEGVENANFGKTDSYFLVDSSLKYQVNEILSFFGGVRNLTDKEYIVSRHPIGPRPGKPLTSYIGAELKF